MPAGRARSREHYDPKRTHFQDSCYEARKPGEGTGFMLALIGGTGIYDLPLFTNRTRVEIETDYGEATVCRCTIRDYDTEIIFLPRHGQEHTLPPHRINHLANIAALRTMGVNMIIATAAVGSLREVIAPGTLVILDQFIDLRRGRTETFFDSAGDVRHTDFTEPYCPWLREKIISATVDLDIPVIKKGCYVCVEGPRYETPAEVRMFAMLGGDVVGMTGVPEAVLARETGICYAGIALVTNLGAGLGPGRLSHGEVARIMARHRHHLTELITSLLPVVLSAGDVYQRGCRCGQEDRQ